MARKPTKNMEAVMIEQIIKYAQDHLYDKLSVADYEKFIKFLRKLK